MSLNLRKLYHIFWSTLKRINPIYLGIVITYVGQIKRIFDENGILILNSNLK